jgi:DNA-binding CsgD family transcriptional regulator
MVAVDKVARGERFFSGGSRPPGTQLSITDAAAAAGLSTREREVLKLIAAGMTTKEIAAQLSISVPTVETHRAHLLAKTGSRNVAGLVRFALQGAGTAS